MTKSAAPPRPHQLRGVSHGVYKFHCVHCDKYFTREPKAYTCEGTDQEQAMAKSSAAPVTTLKGEGETKIVKRVFARVECGNCGELAEFKHTYLLPNARTNKQSRAYGRDDCSWSSDREELTCRECPKPEIDGYEWCATFEAEKFQHMFLSWQEKEITPAHQALYEALSALYAGVPDYLREDKDGFRDELQFHVPVLMGAIRKARAALALADAAQGEK